MPHTASGARWRFWVRPNHRRVARNRNALPATLTDDSAIAAAAMIGESRMRKLGERMPAAIGMLAACCAFLDPLSIGRLVRQRRFSRRHRSRPLPEVTKNHARGHCTNEGDYAR
jgi:hypothetical protein